MLLSCQTDGYELVWYDEFDYDGLPDTTMWSYDTQGNNKQWGNNELQFYTHGQPENVWVQNGKLFISALQTNDQDKPYTSTRLITKGKGEWTYGKIEVCAKLAGGKGAWPAIWMLPSDDTYGQWPASGEIDIMEYVGYESDSVYSTIHSGAYNHIEGTQKTSATFVSDAESAFHVYSLEWSEKSCQFFIDGRKHFEYNKGAKATSHEWPFDQSFYLILNIAVGGDWGGKYGVDESIFPCTMEVDYVRVYQRN